MNSTLKHEGYVRILLLVVPYVFVIGIFQLIGYAIAGVDFDNVNVVKTSQQEIVTSIFNLLGTIGVIWIFTKFVDKIKIKEIGFHSTNIFKESLFGFIIGASAISIGFIILLFTKDVIINGFEFNRTEILLTILIFIFVAISEEVLCRGYILRNLMVSFNKYVALIFSSLVFSLLHAINPNANFISLISLFIAGLLYGCTYIFNYRLWFPISVHFSWNLLQSFLGFNVSGHNHYFLLKTEILGEDYITGGSFGFEGSIYSIFIQGLLVFGILLYNRKKLTTTNPHSA